MHNLYQKAAPDFAAPHGAWADATTFELEYGEVANIDNFVLKMRYRDNSLVMDSADPMHEATTDFEGKAR
ncbi:MAG: hypothetical protein ACJ789_13390 [Thermomicrobiales bacterium]